jgi:hypothetical protein
VSKPVLVVSDVAPDKLNRLLDRYGLTLVMLDDDVSITGSFWGDPEAGIVERQVFVRRDTPVHSLLHEVCHLVCMNEARRNKLNTDAGGDDLEESAVCYLQIVLAECLDGVGSARLMRDMDSWGYSFRLGSTRRWWLEDAEDASKWLIGQGLLTETGEPVFVLRV